MATTDQVKLHAIILGDVVSWKRHDGIEIMGKCVGWHQYRFQHFCIIQGRGARDFHKIALKDILSRQRPHGETMIPLRFE